MSIDDILNAMEDLIDRSTAFPFGGRCLVDAERLSHLIAAMRTNLPREVEQARIVVNERKRIVSEAQEEGNKIIRKANERANQLVDQSEIVARAQQKAEELNATARRRYFDFQNTTKDYIENMLIKSEETHAKALNEIRKTREAFKKYN